jgi:hypothetical protein
VVRQEHGAAPPIPALTTITVIGRLYDEATNLAVALAYQEATERHPRRPPGFDP